MHFEGEFSVPGNPADVIRRFADVPRMARCMPGAKLEPRADDGSWPGAMVVSFGPKKINFKGKATTEFDFDALTGSVHGRGTADMRAARIGVKVTFALREDAASATPATIVKIVSDAELGGVLADFARTGGIAVANVIMADFAKRCAAEFSRDEPPPSAPAAADPMPSEPAGAAAQGDAETQTATLHQPTASTAPRISPVSPPQPAPRYSEPAPEPVPLAAHTLLWAVIKAQFAQFLRWIGVRR